MKYTTEVVINLPRKEVIEKLDNPDNMKHWQRGLLGYKLLEGVPGKEGAQMELEYKMGKRSMVLTETITHNNFPDEFHATYHTPSVHNIQQNFFVETAEGRTKWTSKSEFQFSSFVMKAMAFLMLNIRFGVRVPCSCTTDIRTGRHTEKNSFKYCSLQLFDDNP